MNNKILGIIVSLCCTAIFLICFGTDVYAEIPTVYNVEAGIYNFGKNSKYEINSSEKTTGEALGKFYVNGDINSVTKYNGYAAYGVESGSVTFSYIYGREHLGDKEDYRIIEDKDDVVNGSKLSEKIMKGALLLQKSDDGTNWTDCITLVNYLETYDETQGKALYTTDGADLGKGCYYRLIIAYKTQQKKGFLSSDVVKHADVYEFYLCNNSGRISIHNLANKNEKFELDTGFGAELNQKGETLENGSVTSEGFSVDKLGTPSYKVKVNGIEVNDGAQYTMDGKYEIEVSTMLGKTSRTVVYIYNYQNNDKGYSTYFDGGLIQGNRAFRDGEFPCYSRTSCAIIKKVSVNTPPLSGYIINNDTKDKISVASDTAGERKYKLSPGSYTAELYIGNKTAGSVIEYTFNFNIISDDSGPYVNYNNLMSPKRISNFRAKHYKVAYETTRGGHIYVWFSDSDEAFRYAYEIEKRFIEKKDDGVYYKSQNNPNEKIKYSVESHEDQMYLTKILNFYAHKNVSAAYFDPTEEFTYQTYHNGSDMLDSLENMSIVESINVFPSEAERDDLLDITPYLNGFTFISAADYDVTSVAVQCRESGENYNIHLSKPVDDQLMVTSEYTITETNMYGEHHTYNAVYMAQNETVSELEITNSSGIASRTVSAADNGQRIEADSVTIKSSGNKWDANAIVRINSNGIYPHDYSSYYCLVSECEGLILNRAGKYTLTFTDRTGSSYAVEIGITGNSNASPKDGQKTYTELYNELYGTNYSE